MPTRQPTIHHRRWRTLRARVIREEPNCWLQLPGCTGVSNTVDHVIPRSVRPDLTMTRSNLRGACSRCNYSRGNKSIATLHRRQPPRTPARALSFFEATRPTPVDLDEPTTETGHGWL